LDQAPRQRALSQITENRKVWTRKPLIFQYTIFEFCLEKAMVRQSRSMTVAIVVTMRGGLPIVPL